MHINFKYKRKGKLFASKLQHKIITQDRYIIQLCRYIHYNPVKANLVSKVEDWEYSNYLEYVGKRKGSLYSPELIKMYPDEFSNYGSTLYEYARYVKDQKLKDLLID